MNRVIRKKLLVAQGALHRAEIVMARQAAQESFSPGAISRKLPQFALFAWAALRKPNGAGMLGMGLPALTAGLAALVKGKSVFKPVIRSIVIAGVVAGIASLITKSKSQPASDTVEHP